MVNMINVKLQLVNRQCSKLLRAPYKYYSTAISLTVAADHCPPLTTHEHLAFESPSAASLQGLAFIPVELARLQRKSEGFTSFQSRSMKRNYPSGYLKTGTGHWKTSSSPSSLPLKPVPIMRRVFFMSKCFLDPVKFL